jgi:hypothetical protein
MTQSRRLRERYSRLQMTKLLRNGLLFLAIHAVTAAPGSPDAAFETFKGLQGKWAIQSDGKTLSIEMTYEVGSKGSIVTEQFGKELSVIYRDGQSVLMTHFCNGGTQPRLRLRESSQPGVLEFEMFDITNLKSADAAHVQRIIYRIVDDRKFDLEIVWQVGKTQKSEKYTLTRI